MDAGSVQNPVRAVLSGGFEESFREDGRNVLPHVTGSSHPVVGRIQMADGGRGIVLLEETDSYSTVFIVRGGDGFGVSVSPPIDVSQEGNGGGRHWGNTSPV